MTLVAAGGAASLTALGLLLGVAALLALWTQSRRRPGMGVQRETVPLGAGQALHVVELDGRRLLIGTGPGAAPRLLTELRGPTADAGSEGRPEARDLAPEITP